MHATGPGKVLRNFWDGQIVHHSNTSILLPLFSLRISKVLRKAVGLSDNSSFYSKYTFTLIFP